MAKLLFTRPDNNEPEEQQDVYCRWYGDKKLLLLCYQTSVCFLVRDLLRKNLAAAPLSRPPTSWVILKAWWVKCRLQSHYTVCVPRELPRCINLFGPQESAWCMIISKLTPTTRSICNAFAGCSHGRVCTLSDQMHFRAQGAQIATQTVIHIVNLIAAWMAAWARLHARIARSCDNTGSFMCIWRVKYIKNKHGNIKLSCPSQHCLKVSLCEKRK